MIFLLLLMMIMGNVPLFAMEQYMEEESHRRERQKVLHEEELPERTLKILARAISEENMPLIRETLRTSHPDAKGSIGLTGLAIAGYRNVALNAAAVQLWSGASYTILIKGRPLNEFIFPHNVFINDMIGAIAGAQRALFAAIDQGNFTTMACDIKELAKALSEQVYFITHPMKQERDAALQRAQEAGSPVAFFLGTDTLADQYAASQKVLTRILLQLPLKIHDEQGNTLLHHAVLTNNLGTVRQIYNIYPELLEEHNNQGQTPLDLAAGEIRQYLENARITQGEAEANRAAFLGTKHRCAVQ